jgi:hypothetical protein
MENNSLEQLIQLKFSLEKEINILRENQEKLEFRKQKQLLAEVNKILEEKCEHNWIEDAIDEPLSTRYICYCSECYLYKKNIKVTE